MYTRVTPWHAWAVTASRLRSAIGAATLLVVLGAGCGGDGDEGSGGAGGFDDLAEESDDTEVAEGTEAPTSEPTDDTEVTDETEGPDETDATDDPVDAPVGPADAMQFTDPDGSFSVGTGPTWVLQDEQVTGTANATFWTVGPVVDGFAPNVNIIIQPFRGNIEEYVEFSVEQGPITPGVSDFRVSGRATVDGPGGELGVLRYTAFIAGRSLQFVGVAAVGDGEAVLATFTAPPGTFDELIGEVEPYLLTLERT